MHICTNKVLLFRCFIPDSQKIKNMNKHGERLIYYIEFIFNLFFFIFYLMKYKITSFISSSYNKQKRKYRQYRTNRKSSIIENLSSDMS